MPGGVPRRPVPRRAAGRAPPERCAIQRRRTSTSPRLRRRIPSSHRCSAEDLKTAASCSPPWRIRTPTDKQRPLAARTGASTSCSRPQPKATTLSGDMYRIPSLVSSHSISSYFCVLSLLMCLCACASFNLLLISCACACVLHIRDAPMELKLVAPSCYCRPPHQPAASGHHSSLVHQTC